MFKNLKRAGIVAALAVGAMTVSTSAQARDRYWHHRGDDDAALAIGAGIIGLAIGAAIASDHDRGYYYDDGYYYGRPRGYYYPRYYYREYPRYRYYRDYPRRDYYYYRGDRGRWGGHWNRGWHRGW
jgi:hypothetical protein